MEEEKAWDENPSEDAIEEVQKVTRSSYHILSQKEKAKKQYQKKQIRKSYASTYRKNMQKQAREKVKKSATKVTQSVVQKRRRAGIGIALLFLLFMVVIVGVSSCSLMAGEAVLMALSGSYFSNPSDIEKAELCFMEWEMELENRIQHIETEYPDYDEYRYAIGEIGHHPFVLIGYLSAIYPGFTYEDVDDELISLFEEMYELQITSSTEIRTRIETRTRMETHTRTEIRTRTEIETRIEIKTRTETHIGVREVVKEDGSIGYEFYTYDVEVEYEEEVDYEIEVEYEVEVPYQVEVTYEVEVEYEVTILTTTLTTTPLETVVSSKMTEDEKELYLTYMETKGMLQSFAPPLDGNWQGHISCYYGYRVHPISGENQLHRGVDIAMPEGTPIYATHNGTVTTATYNSSYGNYVVLTDEEGTVTKYAHMKELFVSEGMEIVAGTQIGTVGSTGVSTGNHLHLELLVDGEYYNPIFYFESGI